MVLLSPCADESLASLLVRLARFNGYADYRSLIEKLFPGRPCVSFVSSEIDLPKFCHRTNSAYGDPISVLEMLTSKNLECMAGDGNHQALVSIAQGINKPSLADLTFFPSPILRFCPECRAEDLRTIGMSYWRRIHQLPIVFYCPAHGGALIEAKMQRHRLHQTFPMPTDFEIDAEAQRITEKCHSLFWLSVSRFVERFREEVFAYDGLTIQDALIDSLCQKKLADPRGGVHSRHLTGELQRVFDELSVGKEIARKIFLREIATSVEDRSGRKGWGRLVLLTWLFGNWESFAEHYRWASVFGRSYDDSQLRRSKSDLGECEFTQRYKQKCLEYLAANPGCSRLQFLHGDYRTFRWLRRNEKDWLDKQLPRPKRAGAQLDLF